ncbi:MAG: dihydrofolate reductase [Puniceicoccales bacterium]|jgi:dihydrofolate reductase|nr:dihydrofolate reductase [Puniceicoccales bacterium]
MGQIILPEAIPSMRAIVAMDPSGVIGFRGRLPWHLPEDLRLFRSMTMGHTLLMGRKTFESLAKPLPGRTCWILSRRGDGDGRFHHAPAQVFSSVDAMLRAVRAELPPMKFWVAGGAEIYNQLAPHCVEIIQTALVDNYAGDSHWQIPPGFVRGEVILSTNKFTTYRWHRYFMNEGGSKMT